MGTWVGELASHALDAATTGNPQTMLALFFVAALTEIGLPFPLVIDSVLFLLGYHVLNSWFPALAVMLVGRESGAAAAYWVCRLVRIRIGSRLGQRFSPLRRLSEWLSKRLGTSPIAMPLARLGIQSSSLVLFRAPACAFHIRSLWPVLRRDC